MNSDEFPLIALVEDEEHLAQGLLFNLQAEGYRTHHEADGDAALAWLLAAPPSGPDRVAVAVLDCMLPGTDGFEIVRTLREQQRYTPVLLLTARSRPEDILEGLEAGADDYLPKPFNPVLLRARLTACLERKRLRDQEVDYLQQVDRVTAAAAAIKANTFQSENLDEVAQRSDELGQLAQVFQEMARQVYAREQRLQRQVQQLRIEIDQAHKAREVAEITESEYFQQLLGKAEEIRNRARVDTEDSVQANTAREPDGQA